MSKSQPILTTHGIAMHSQVRSKEAEAAENMVQQYYSRIRSLALAMLKDPDDAEDAAQETFIQATMKLDGFQGGSSLKTWLYAIAINECRGRLRKRQVQNRLRAVLQALQSITHRTPSPEEASIESEACHELWQAVEKLEEPFRLPVLLRYLHDLNVPEIAQVLSLPEGTIHSRLHRARQRLQTLVEPHLAEPQEE